MGLLCMGSGFVVRCTRNPLGANTQLAHFAATLPEDRRGGERGRANRGLLGPIPTSL